MAIGVKSNAFAGWAGLIFELGAGGLTPDMAPLRGSNTELVFTPGLRLGLQYGRPSGSLAH